jgi:transcriptional regulator with XRE-family HTH domain
MTAPIILGEPKREFLGKIGAALLQTKNANKLTLDEMAETMRRSDEAVAQYISGESEMGVTAWLRAVKAWPDLEDRLSYHLMDEAEKAFRASQRSLNLPPPNTAEDEAA